MEDEINTAQAILKRDLALHRTIEKQKAEKELAPKEVREEPVAQQTGGAKADEDVIMLDEPAELPKASAPQDNGAATTSTKQTEPVQPKQQPQPSATITEALAATTAPTAAPDQPAATAEQQTSPLMAGSANGEIDFSSLFGDDLGANSADTTNDAQLDLPADFGDSGADVSSLLPGLESYANIADENSMPDIPTSSAPGDTTGTVPDFNFSDLTQPQTDSNVAQAQATDGGDQTGEVDFGDLGFNFDDTRAGGGVGEETQEGDNTFDDLFDLDQYDFSGDAANSKAGQDMEDWMDSL